MQQLAQVDLGAAIGVIAGGLLIGGFSFFCAFQDYDWFMNNRRAALLVMILGRPIARIFYMLLGIVFIAGGLILGIGALMGK